MHCSEILQQISEKKMMTMICITLLVGLLNEVSGRPIPSVALNVPAEEFDGQDFFPMEQSRVKRDQRMMPVSEIEDAVRAQIERYDNDQNGCDLGKFYSPATRSCERCEKFCRNGTDLTSKDCVEKCIVYYMLRTTKNLKVQPEESKSEEGNKDGSGLAPVWGAIATIGVAVIILSIVLVKESYVVKKEPERTHLHCHPRDDSAGISDNRDDGVQTSLMEVAEE